MRSYEAACVVVLLLACTLDLPAQSGDKPLSVVFLVDVSVSQEGRISPTKKAARASVDTILNSVDDRAAVVTFSRTPTIRQPMTGDLKQIDSALQRIKFEPPPGYVGGGVVVGSLPVSKQALALSGTSVWDSVWFTEENVFIQPTKEGRQAIILVTDGEDTGSRRKLEDVIARAVELNIVIYAIGAGDEKGIGRNKVGLQKLSDKTGGKAFFPGSEKEMTEALEQIGTHLRMR